MREKGFTLIEIMVALAILGIAAAMAIPSFSEMINNQRVRSLSADYYSLIQYARNEAIRSGADVELVPSCKGQIGPQYNDWRDGAAVVPVVVSGVSEPLRFVAGRKECGQASCINIVESTKGATKLIFNGRGLLNDSYQFDFVYDSSCGASGVKGKRIEIIASGFAAVK